jgi:hypothetical protein
MDIQYADMDMDMEMDIGMDTDTVWDCGNNFNGQFLKN